MNQDKYDGLGSQGYTGALNDRLRAMYIALGASGGALQDLEESFLLSNGIAPAALQDMWASYLSTNSPPWFATLPLDSLSASAAYSTRKLRTAYAGAAMRVRRSSDNAEQDIGFGVDGWLDETALLAHAGAGSGFVTSWYDQSGNGVDVIQATAAQQPEIVASGVINRLNSRPTTVLNLASLTGATFDTPNATLITVTSNIGVSAIEAARPFGISASVVGLKQSFMQALDGSLRLDGAFATGAPLPAGGLVRTATRTTAQLNDWRNGAAGISSAITLPNSIGNIAFNTNRSSMGKISEAMFFTRIVSTTERQTIERNQGAYFGITVA